MLKCSSYLRTSSKRLLAEGVDPSQHKKALQAAKIAAEANAFENIARDWMSSGGRGGRRRRRGGKFPLVSRRGFCLSDVFE
jgi:hypothetical protein